MVVQTRLAGQEPPKEDKRLILRLGQDHDWRRLSPVKIKKLITERAGIAFSAIKNIHQVRSGLAIECVPDALKETILEIWQSFQQEKITIEAALDYISMIVPRCHST